MVVAGRFVYDILKDFKLTVLVLEELWEVEELRDELLDIIGVVHEGLPRCWDGVELAVCTVKPEPPQGGYMSKHLHETLKAADVCRLTYLNVKPYPTNALTTTIKGKRCNSYNAEQQVNDCLTDCPPYRPL